MLRFTRTRAPAEPRGRRVGAAVLAGSLVAVAAVVAVAGVSLPSVGVPAPDARGAALTWDELAWLGVWDGNRGTMPTAADYVTHIAFQEGLPYGRAYRLPEEGERLPLSSFRFDTGARRLIRDERVVVIYDQSWLERVIAEARGVGRLLVDAGAVTVQRRLLADVAPSRRPPGSVIALALVSAGIAVGTGLWAAPARTQRR
jgi:hypothetical protein